MSELADRLVDAAVMASEDCGCGPNESAIVAAVLREIGTWGEMQKYPVNLFTTLAEQIVVQGPWMESQTPEDFQCKTVGELLRSNLYLLDCGELDTLNRVLAEQASMYDAVPLAPHLRDLCDCVELELHERGSGMCVHPPEVF